VTANFGLYIGAEGKVDESLAVLAEVETLKTKKKEAEVTACMIVSLILKPLDKRILK